MGLAVLSRVVLAEELDDCRFRISNVRCMMSDDGGGRGMLWFRWRCLVRMVSLGLRLVYQIVNGMRVDVLLVSGKSLSSSTSSLSKSCLDVVEESRASGKNPQLRRIDFTPEHAHGTFACDQGRH